MACWDEVAGAGRWRAAGSEGGSEGPGGAGDARTLTPWLHPPDPCSPSLGTCLRFCHNNFKSLCVIQTTRTVFLIQHTGSERRVQQHFLRGRRKNTIRELIFPTLKSLQLVGPGDITYIWKNIEAQLCKHLYMKPISLQNKLHYKKCRPCLKWGQWAVRRCNNCFLPPKPEILISNGTFQELHILKLWGVINLERN